MKYNYKVSIDSFLGIQTARPQSLISFDIESKDYLLYPMGNMLYLHSHSSSFQVKKKKMCEDAIQHLKQLDQNMFIFNTYDGLIVLFSFNQDLDFKIEKVINLQDQAQQLSRIEAILQNESLFISYTMEDKLFLIQNETKILQIDQKFEHIRFFQFDSITYLFAIRCLKEYIHEALVYNFQGEIIKQELICDNLKWRIVHLVNHGKNGIIKGSDKRIILIDFWTLRKKEIFIVQEKFINLGPTYCREGVTWMSLGNKTFIKMYLNELLDQQEDILVIDLKKNEWQYLKVIETSFLMNSFDICMNFSKDFRSLLVLGSQTKRWITCDQKDLFEHHVTHEIEENQVHTTCCGASLSFDKQLIAIGDFGGQIHIYSTKNLTQVLLKYKLPLIEIRCLAWQHSLEEDNYTLLVGLMSGTLFQLEFENKIHCYIKKKTQIQFAHQTITNIRCTTYQNENHTLLSNTYGKIYIINNNLEIVSEFQAHAPQKDNSDKRFPSLHLKNEIWSLCVNDGALTHFLSASEDSTMKLFNFQQVLNQDFQPIQILKGHQMAVTSLDWKKDTMVSCSDDQTLRIYHFNKRNFDFLRILDTKFLKAWHTLTYLSLHTDAQYLSTVTEHGYLVIWDIENGDKTIYARRIHHGSIEALDQKDNRLVCCASDCAASYIQVDF